MWRCSKSTWQVDLMLFFSSSSVENSGFRIIPFSFIRLWLSLTISCRFLLTQFNSDCLAYRQFYSHRWQSKHVTHPLFCDRTWQKNLQFDVWSIRSDLILVWECHLIVVLLDVAYLSEKLSTFESNNNKKTQQQRKKRRNIVGIKIYSR